ncbi:MAG: MFS transporter [Chloroflexi bacterium]|nr:MFS transporter [Chloroflexota bacterium]MBV9892736.1 MFS transporter [Chloroflexota bacterium]
MAVLNETLERASTDAATVSWQRNLYALTAAAFLMFTAFGFVFPFLPLFIAQLGVGDVQQVEVWSGVSSFGQAIVLSVFSPIWGALADRHGRRLMVLRAAFGGGVIIALMGLSQNIWQFMGLRLVQGAMTGVVAAASALAISFVPRNRIGTALGLIQMSSFAGNAVGPSLGGFTADHFGYRLSFVFSGGLFILAGIVTVLFVKEHFIPPPPEQTKPGLTGILRDIRSRGRDKQLLIMMVVLFSAQFGVNVVQPMLPLFVQYLDPGESAATLTGLIFTVAGVVAAVSSLIWGRLGDRIGYRRLLIGMALGAGLIYIPQALVVNVIQLIALRGILGVFDGGLLPSANALIASSTQPNQRSSHTAHGTTYGLVYLANGLGFALGPLAGGVIAATLGLRNVFFLTAAILLVIGMYLPFGVKEQRRAS